MGWEQCLCQGRKASSFQLPSPWPYGPRPLPSFQASSHRESCPAPRAVSCAASVLGHRASLGSGAAPDRDEMLPSWGP